MLACAKLTWLHIWILTEVLTPNQTQIALSAGRVSPHQTFPVWTIGTGKQSAKRQPLRLCVRCCISLSTAGSAVGPCGSAGRMVRRCLSAASTAFVPHIGQATEQKRQVDPPPASHPRFEQLTGASETKSGLSQRG